MSESEVCEVCYLISSSPFMTDIASNVKKEEENQSKQN